MTLTIPTYTVNGVVHWRKWPGRLACGGSAAGPIDQRFPGHIDCDTCQQLVASAHAGCRFELVIFDGLAINKAGLDQLVFPTWSAAQTALKDVRRRAFHLRKVYGQVPRFRLMLNVQLVEDPAALMRHATISDGGDTPILQAYPTPEPTAV